MPKIDRKGLKDQIKSGNFYPVYLLMGSESYSVLKYKALLVDALVKNMPDMNLNTFDGTKADTLDIIEACNQLPVFNEHRVVVVNDLFLEKSDGEQLKVITDYLQDPNELTVLIFVYSGNNPPKKEGFKGLINAVESAGGLCEFKELSENEIVKYLSKIAGKNNCIMQASAARYLMDCCGTSVLSLNNEMDKLCAYKSGGEITEEDIDILCPKLPETDVFNMTNKISRNQTGAALKILSDLLLQKQEPTQIFGALCHSYIAMYRCLAAEKSGKSYNEMAIALKVKNPSSLSKNASGAKRLGPEKIQRSLNALLECDRILKSTGYNQAVILEQTIVTLCAISAKK